MTTTAAATPAIVNALSIDVEDWFQVSAFAPHIDRRDWALLPCRVERNVDLLLGMLADAQTRATFFTLGWIAVRYPALVRRIVSAGHELASHGYGHERATDLTPAAFHHDLMRARQVLEDASGIAVIGYRAPSFSIGPDTPWAHEIIAQTGHRYSSSLFPVAHDHYGSPHAPRFAHCPIDGLWELPLATLRWQGRNYPIAGGGWFRLLPYRLSAWGLHRLNTREGQPAITYFHPWEFDPAQPRPARMGARTRFRHYLNLDRTQTRLTRLLREFRWDRIDTAFARQLQATPSPCQPADARQPGETLASCPRVSH